MPKVFKKNRAAPSGPPARRVRNSLSDSWASKREDPHVRLSVPPSRNPPVPQSDTPLKPSVIRSPTGDERMGNLIHQHRRPLFVFVGAPLVYPARPEKRREPRRAAPLGAQHVAFTCGGFDFDCLILACALSAPAHFASRCSRMRDRGARAFSPRRAFNRILDSILEWGQGVAAFTGCGKIQFVVIPIPLLRERNLRVVESDSFCRTRVDPKCLRSRELFPRSSGVAIPSKGGLRLLPHPVSAATKNNRREVPTSLPQAVALVLRP
jgi:hypothetical protein